MTTDSSTDAGVYFDGSNWQDLQRLVTSSRMKFLQTSNLETDPYENDEAKCAYLISHFRGPALDWAGQQFDQNPATLNQWGPFIQNVRNAFGVTDQGLSAQWRAELEALKWRADLPVFFAEFDRITTLLQLNGNDTRIALVRSKLPPSVQKLLAEQALNFHEYATMRERLLTMWALDPNKYTSVSVGGSSSTTKRPRCGRCGKKGHAATDCRAKN
jgi:hypothetical protein